MDDMAIDVRIDKAIYIRRGAGKDFDSIGSISPSGKIITMDGVESGKVLKGNNKWYFKINDKGEKQYYWGGGISMVDQNSSVLSSFTNANVPWWIQQLKIPEIWSTYSEKGADARIAILDTGYKKDNPEIVIADFFNTVGGTSTIDDGDGHGTYCTSIIGARNNTRIIGCAPQAQLFSGKITQNGSVSYQKICSCITWAVKKQVDIISISYGGPNLNDNLRNAIHDAVNTHNIVVIAPIGNNNPPQGQAGGNYPGLFDDCITVGATDSSNRLSGVTMVNDKTDINAPGDEIDGYALDNTPTQLPAGTSQATAVVAGVCGLIISRFKASHQSYSPQSIKQLIVQNFDPVVGSPDQKLISPTKIFSKT